MRRGPLVLSLLPALALGVHPSRADQATWTVEQGCTEVNEARLADPAAVGAALPEGWRPRVLANGRAQTFFVDYTCDSLEVDGGPGRRTTVSMLVALGSTRTDGTPGTRNWVLWHGTDNPLLVRSLKQSGVESRFLPRTEVAVGRADGRVVLEVRYVDDRPGAGLDYVRRTSAPTPTGELVEAPGGVFSFPTEAGVVEVAYANRTRTVRPVTTSQSFAATSLPRALGIADLPPTTSTSLSLTEGSWTSTLTEAALPPR